MFQWIFVVYYLDEQKNQNSKILKAFRTEQAALDYIDILNNAPFPELSLLTGKYLCKKIVLA